MKAKTISKCRICGSSLIDILSLGNQTLGNIFLSSQDKQPPSAPLDLVRCNSDNNGGCGLVQLKHTVPPHLLYNKYWYLSGINDGMKKHLSNIAGKAESMVGLQSGDVVLDIGCNDGTLLSSYKNNGIRRIGIDPAKNLIELARRYTNIETINDFFSSNAFFKASKAKAKIITSIAMFYDLEDPNKFVFDIGKTLDDDGLWIVELSYLPMMLNWNSFDTICHEHLEYYSLAAIEYMLTRNNLEIIDIEFNNINGGSFRLYIMHKGKKKPSNLTMNAREKEDAMNLKSSTPYEIFRKNIEIIRQRLTDHIVFENKAGKKIYIYGASTKGNTILQYCRLDNSIIKAAADRNPDKWGKVTPGTNIPIISEEEARAANPDYFLVLPWHFIEGFIMREKKFLESGGKFILPLPNVRIIDKNVIGTQKI